MGFTCARAPPVLVLENRTADACCALSFRLVSYFRFHKITLVGHL